MTNAMTRITPLISLALLLAIAGEAIAEDASETVMIPARMSFGDVSVRAGLYLAREADDGTIELQSTVDGSVVNLPAERGRHTQSIGERTSVAVRADATQTHVLVLLPDGTQRRAVGVSGGSGRARPVDTPAQSVQAEVQRAEGRLPQLADSSSQVVGPAPRVTGAQMAQQRYQQAAAAAQAEEEETAAAADEEPVVEYTFNVPLNLQSMPASAETISIWIMLGTAPFNDNALMSDPGGRAVGWGQAFVPMPSNGSLQTNVAVPVDWYGPGTGGNPVPFPTHYVVYIGLNPVGGPRECGTNTEWESQARCGTPFRPLVTGTLPGQ